VLVLAGAAVAAPHAGRSVPKQLVGTYEAYLGAGPGTAKPGRWELAIGRRGGAAIVTPQGYKLVEGPISVSGTTITFPVEARKTGCKTTGRYRYAQSGDYLRLTRLADACRVRAFRLASGRWKRFSDYFPVVIVRH
jgi:hypothetical protein